MVNTRKAHELLWNGSCTIKIRQENKDSVTKRIKFDEVSIYEDKPCKLSYVIITATNENNNAAIVIQKAKLIIAPEIDIPPGSKIIVTQNGKTAEYEKSGEPGMFSNHQEVILELFKGWS